jgi:hypothetical protein
LGSREQDALQLAPREHVTRERGDPESIPARFLSRTGLRFVLDTHLLDDESLEMVKLRELHEDGWIDLTRTDVMDTELQEAAPEKAGHLLMLSGEYVEHFGPMVLDHSRWDRSVWGSEDDAARLETVFAILFPGADRRAARRQHTRDAMNVATAIRYGATGFITNEKRLLNKSEVVKERFNGFLLYSPSQALVVSERFVARHRELALRKEERDRGDGG